LLYADIVEPAIFFSTFAIIIIHIPEWIDIVDLTRQQHFTNSKILLKGGLGIEIFYYFSLLIVWVVFFPKKLVFLTLIAFLGIVHLAVFQAALSRKIEKWLSHIRNRSIAGVIGFDIIELMILVALALQFHPSTLRLV
jgi:hypothetical protein